MSFFDGRRYPSDLTDAQWAIVEPLIPKPSTQGRPPHLERRTIVNAILYVLRSGCPWRLLPLDFPAWQTVYSSFRQWQRAGVWDQMVITLRMQMRVKQGRNPEPSAAAIDSQSIKTSAVRGPEKGYDPGKKVWGRKRHVLVDTEGNLLAIKVTGAEQSDQQGGKRLVLPLRGRFPRLQLLWGDSHYGGTFVTWLKEHLGWKMQTVLRAKIPARGLLVAEGEEPDWEARFPSGFVPLPRRWVVERTFSWISRWRRLARDHEGLPQCSEALITLAMSRLMLSRLVPFSP